MLSRFTLTSAAKKLLPTSSESTVPRDGLAETWILEMTSEASESGIELSFPLEDLPNRTVGCCLTPSSPLASQFDAAGQ